MGLDQWLYVKTKLKVEDKGNTGVCSSLFPLVPSEANDKIEIGYWRKAYDQDQLINQLASSVYPKDEKGETIYSLNLTKEDVENILQESKRILKEHSFDPDDEDDLTCDDPKFDSETYTWMSKTKWENTIKFFEEAKRILEEDPEAEIIYHIWF